MSKLEFDSESIFYKSFVCLNFANNIQQQIPISVKTYAPRLSVTTDLINFGKTLIDQERQLQFFIRNNSFSSAIWNIKIGRLNFLFLILFLKKKNLDDCDGVFDCDKKQGFIESKRKSINKCEQIINVFFKAK